MKKLLRNSYTMFLVFWGTLNCSVTLPFITLDEMQLLTVIINYLLLYM